MKKQHNYYDSRQEAEQNRKTGDRIYFDATRMKYYIVKKKKKSFWDVWLE